MNKFTQHQKIWNWLVSHKLGITPMQAFKYLNITKLATRIGEMEKELMPNYIKSEWIHSKIKRNICKRYSL